MSEESPRANAPNLRELAGRVLAAYLRRNPLPACDVPGVLRDIHRAFEMAAAPNKPPRRPTPAVPARRSVTRHYIICLEDGRKMKTLKRYLRTKSGLGLKPGARRKRRQ